MRVFLFSTLLEEQVYEQYQIKEKKFNPGQKFYQLLYDGLCMNGVQVIPFTMISVHMQEYTQAYGSSKWNYFYYSNRFERKSTAKKIADEAAKIIDSKNDIILADAEAYWTMRAALYCRKKCGCHILEVITDFPHHVYSYSEERMNDQIFLRMMRYVNAYSKLFAIKSADAYVLLTENMTDVVGKYKPYVVVEGFSQKHPLYHTTVSNDAVKKIVYLGSLNGQSGILSLVEACHRLTRNDYVLQIYGDGAAKDAIVEFQEKDSRIQYCGVVSLNEVSEVEQTSDLLINPRPSKGGFNKYSFPSKTLEYMSSGTPMCSTRLECISKEYEPYIYWVSDESIESMSKDIDSILDYSKKDLREMGKRGRDFVLSYKNNQKQAKKILDLVEYILQ